MKCEESLKLQKIKFALFNRTYFIVEYEVLNYSDLIKYI